MREAYLFLFMGQSNMAGRGVASLAPAVREGWGFEFRAVTRPDSLVHLEEPFGAEENNPEGVFEPGMKTGSLASAFVNAAYPLLEKSIVCVSCAKGGSSINEWQPGTPYFRDALGRLEQCRSVLVAKRCRILGTYMLWCQGCTDGDNRMPGEEYREKTERFILSFLEKGGVDRCFFLRIGDQRELPGLYGPIQEAQERLCADSEKIVMVSRSLKTMAARGLMKDVFHYLQPAYNEAGAEAGQNAALYIRKKDNRLMDQSVSDVLREKARRIREGIVNALGLGRPGHLGGSMSAADVMAVLYFYKMRIDPKNPKMPDRDRFIMSKGHSVLAQYAALAEAGFFPKEELPKTKTLGALLQGHPEITIPGIEANTGSLGQGLSQGVGMALAAKLDKADWRVYVMTGDGELAEGQIWEAATAAGHYRLDNLRVLVDANGISAMGRIRDRYNTGDPERIAAKFAAFGWSASVVNGHDLAAVASALDAADRVKGQPCAIVCRTVKGRGVSFAEDTNAYHNRALDGETREKALAEINA